MSFKIGDTLKLVKTDDTVAEAGHTEAMLQMGEDIILTEEIFNTITESYGGNTVTFRNPRGITRCWAHKYRLSDFGLVLRDGFIALDKGFVQIGDKVTVLDAKLATTVGTLNSLISEGNTYEVVGVYPDENRVQVRMSKGLLSAVLPLNFEGLAMEVLDDTDVEVSEDETEQPLADATVTDFSDVDASDFDDIETDDYVTVLSNNYDESFDGTVNDEPDEETLEIATSITDDSVTIVINGQAELINHDDEHFAEVRQLVFDKKIKEALALINVGQSILNFGQGALQIENGVVTYNGQPLVGELVSRIINMMKSGDEAFKPLAKFLNLVLEQSSFKTRERLMSFAAHGELAITDEGHIIAFKNVDSNYMDKRSGTFRNMVGDSPSMRRSDVDDDHNNSCSNGLHVCAPSYLKKFWNTSGKTMKVSVDPRDMVAVPYDYGNSKARVSKYLVIEDVTGKIDEYLTTI